MSDWTVFPYRATVLPYRIERARAREDRIFLRHHYSYAEAQVFVTRCKPGPGTCSLGFAAWVPPRRLSRWPT